jgi:hypothetical protein
MINNNDSNNKNYSKSSCSGGSDNGLLLTVNPVQLQMVDPDRYKNKAAAGYVYRPGNNNSNIRQRQQRSKNKTKSSSDSSSGAAASCDFSTAENALNMWPASNSNSSISPRNSANLSRNSADLNGMTPRIKPRFGSPPPSALSSSAQQKRQQQQRTDPEGPPLLPAPTSPGTPQRNPDFTPIKTEATGSPLWTSASEALVRNSDDNEEEEDASSYKTAETGRSGFNS